MLFRKLNPICLLLFVTVVFNIFNVSCENLSTPKTNEHLVFSIDDQRKEKTDLCAKYISVDNESVFIEINDDEAILHKSFAEYLSVDFENVKEQKLIISEEDNEINLYFNFIMNGTDVVYCSWFRTKNGDINTFYWGLHDLYALERQETAPCTDEND